LLLTVSINQGKFMFILLTSVAIVGLFLVRNYTVIPLKMFESEERLLIKKMMRTRNVQPVLDYFKQEHDIPLFTKHSGHETRSSKNGGVIACNDQFGLEIKLLRHHTGILESSSKRYNISYSDCLLLADAITDAFYKDQQGYE
jgi:hypothetical protein